MCKHFDTQPYRTMSLMRTNYAVRASRNIVCIAAQYEYFTPPTRSSVVDVRVRDHAKTGDFQSKGLDLLLSLPVSLVCALFVTSDGRPPTIYYGTFTACK